MNCVKCVKRARLISSEAVRQNRLRRAYIVSKLFRRPARSASSEGTRRRETGLSKNSFPSMPYPKCAQMQREIQIPYYAADGTSLGFRSLEAAKRLIESGYVKPAYGRKGHLKAIWLLQEDGGNPVETHARGWHPVQLPGEHRDGPLLEPAAIGPARRGWRARDHARRLPAGCSGVPRRMKARRQVGGRYIARARGAVVRNPKPAR